MKTRDIKSIVLSAMLLIVCSVHSYAIQTDGLYINDFETVPNTAKTVSVNMRNTNVVSGFQFDLLLPSGVTLNSVAPSNSRTSYTYKVEQKTQNDGSIRIVCLSVGNAKAVYSGTDGEVLTLSLTSSSAGNKSLTLKRQYLTESNLEEVSAAETSATMHVHTLIAVKASEATCTETGNSAYWHCSACDGYFCNATATTKTTLSELTVPASGHNLTTADNGDNHTTSCSNCDYSIAEDHAYVDGVCSVCGHKEGSSDPGHEIEPSTDISKYSVALYFNDVEQKAGDFNLELNLKCAEENITAFQCDIYLPEGVEWTYTTDKRGKIVYTLPSFNEDRTDNSYHTISPITKNADGSYKMIVYSMDNEVILETDGVIMTLPLSISEEMATGEYNIFLKNVVVTDKNIQQTIIEKMVSKLTIPSYIPGDVNDDKMVNVTDVVTVISYILGERGMTFIYPAADINGDNSINVTDVVGIIDIILNSNVEISQASRLRTVRKALASGEGCNLEILPFAVSSGTTSASVKLNLNNPGDEFTAFQCDISLPEGIDWKNTVDKRGKVKYEAPVFDSEADRTDASYHTVSAAKNGDDFTIVVYSMEKEVILDEEGAVLDLPFTFDEGLTPGIYDVTIKNMVLTRKDQTQVLPSAYTFSIIVGSPDLAIAKLHGNYNDEAIASLNSVLKDNQTIAAVDLSEATAVSDATEIKGANKNLLVNIAKGTSVKNTQNVVVDGKCEKLVLTDKHPFAAPVAFTATSASYSRTVSNDWGTICLPYAISSDENVQLYQLKSVGENIMMFTEADALEAGEPGVFKKNGTTTSISYNKQNIQVNDAVKETEAVSGFQLVGSYENIAVNAAETPSCYIKDNQFKTGVGTFYIDAFRAYYLDLTGVGTKAFTIAVEDETTGIVSVVGELDAKTGEIYSVNGIRQNAAKGIYIQNGKKYYSK